MLLGTGIQPPKNVGKELEKQQNPDVAKHMEFVVGEGWKNGLWGRRTMRESSLLGEATGHNAKTFPIPIAAQFGRVEKGIKSSYGVGMQSRIMQDSAVFQPGSPWKWSCTHM